MQPGTRGGDLGQSPLNENFKKWFGDSKVVDKDGRPLVVYHGSAVGGITKSDTRATFFSSSNEVANSYAENAPASDFPGAEEERINQAVHLRMVNPLVLDGEGGDWHSIPYNGKVYSTNDLIREAKKRGHDGIIIRSVFDDIADDIMAPSDIYITLGGKAQIKSAIGNSGAFNPNDPNILNQGGEPGTPGELPPGRTPEEVWASMSLDQKRPYHEQWAQSFERYMLEGKAPTTELQPVFARFKAWMLNVYKSLENFLKQNPLAGKLNDEVRGIFDRLIAAEESIRATESIRAYAPLFESAEAAGVTPKQFQEYLEIGRAHV